MDYEVLLLGAAKTGKTTWLRHVVHGESPKGDYCPSSEVNVEELRLQTTLGPITLQIFDLPANLQNRSDHYLHAQGVIYMHDLLDPRTRQAIEEYYREVRRKLGLIPSLVMSKQNAGMDQLADLVREMTGQSDLELVE